MSRTKDDEHSSTAITEGNVSDGLTGRSLSGSFSRSRKSSRVATVKPVTKCLSSSEEDLNKGDKQSSKGSASPRIAKLLSKDMTSLDKDVIVAELEKCLAELENNDNPYSTLSDEYKRMEEERDELAKELENAFGDLEGYMHHVHDIEAALKSSEAALKSSEAERDELAKEVEYLKICLTNRKEIENNSLKAGKEALESQLKEVREENELMKEQVSELLSERESLIQSLLNLHSTEVDDVIQSRSRSCSVVSMESTSSSLLRSEYAELKERVKEAEEAELKITVELQKCKEYLEETLKEKNELENCLKNMKVEISEMEEDEMNFKERIEELNKERKEELKAKDKEINEIKKEMAKMRREHEKSVLNEKKAMRQIESKDKSTAELLKSLEEEKSRLSKELRMVKFDFEKHKSKITEEKKEFDELKSRSKQDAEILRTKSLELENRTLEFKDEKKKRGEIESDLMKARSEKAVIEKQMAEVGEKLLSERAKAKSERKDLEKTLEKLNKELDLEKEKMSNVEKQRLSVDELSEEMRNMTIQNESLNEEIRNLKVEIKKQKVELVTEKSKLMKKESEVIQKEKELTETKEIVAQFRNELKRASNSYKELAGEKSRVEKELEELKEKVRTEKEMIENENSFVKRKIESLQLEVENMQDFERDLVKFKEGLSAEKILREKLELEKNELDEKLKEERERRTIEREKLEIELQMAVESKDELKEKLNKVSGYEEKLAESDYIVRELEQSLSGAGKAKKDVEKKLLSQIRELNLSHEEEMKRLKENISQSSLKSEESYQKEIAHWKSKVDDLNIFIERAETKVREQEVEIKNMKMHSAESEKHVDALRKEKSGMQLEAGRLRSENAALKTDLDKVARQLRNACADVEKAVSEKKLLKEQLERAEFELENRDTIRKESDESLMSEKIDKHLKNHEKLRIELQTEISRFKKEQKDMEVDLKTTKNHLEQAHDKELKYRHSIDGLSENIERLRQEKSHLEKALELRNTENGELSGKLRKLTQNAGIYGSNEIVVENEELRKRCGSLQDEVSKALENNKSLSDKIRKTDEANASNLRSLKARKSELQIQLVNIQHEKEDLEKEVRVLKGEIASLKDNSNSRNVHELDESEVMQIVEPHLKTLRENLEDTEAKVKILERENDEYKEKLHESEELILDLQKAVARANDVAMEKALESSRHKRIFEKKFEKILKENFNLQKQLYFDGPSFVENDRNNHGRSLSEITSPKREIQTSERYDDPVDGVKNKFDFQPQRKKSAGELHTITAHGVEVEKRSSLWRSSSAASAQKEGDMRPVRTRVTVGSVTPPVRYTSDTDSVGSKPDSNDGDFAPSSPRAQKSSPPTYQDANRETLQKEDERQNAIPQPNRIHRPILLKEIKLPNLSLAEERKSQGVYSPGSRSPVVRSPAMRRKQEKRGPVLDRENNVKERMEHWV